MKATATRDASTVQIENGWRLAVGAADSHRYRDAQLDDYLQLPRSRFPHEYVTLSLRARASSNSIAGTWGFGLWNDPVAVSLGLGGDPLRLPALPNAVWFFSASAHNYLSFTEDKPGRGFLAQTFRSPTFHPQILLAGLTLPFSRKTARKLLSQVIADDGAALDVDVTLWHAYRLEWSQNRVLFYVDGQIVFETPISPNPPLGVIIWIDNQYAAFTPEGQVAFGLLKNEEAWLEVRDIVMSKK